MIRPTKRFGIIALGVMLGVLLPPALSLAEAPKPDSDAKEVIEAFGKLKAKPFASITPDVARRQPTFGDAAMKVLQDKGKPTDPLPLASIKSLAIPTDNGELPARVYTPKKSGEPLPVVVYFHGGGWVIANLDTYDGSARALADATQAIIVSVHYRQAPENKFPAAAEDAYAAVQWVMKNAATFGGDPKRVAVAGESAGGNLATVACLMSRDRGGLMPVHQLLVYPVTAYHFDTESYKSQANAKPLDKSGMKWFFAQYLKSPADGKNPYASPLLADLKGLPPATIINAELDPLASDGQLYAEKLKKAGVEVEHKEYLGVPHEFFGLGTVIDDAASAQKLAAKRLTSAFDSAEKTNVASSER